MTLTSTKILRTLLTSVFVVTVAVAGAATPVRAEDKAADAAAFTDKQKQEMGIIIRNYLAENPDVVVDALKAFQEKQRVEQETKTKEALTSRKADIFDATAPFAGAKDGDVTIVEFFDYNCGYCKKALPEVQALLKDDPKLKIIFKDYPILSPTSNDAARWALAANKQGKYFDYHVKLLTEPGEKNTTLFEKIGTDLGLDIEKLRKDADSKEVREELEKKINLAHDLGIGGTPAFIIGDQLIPGYVPSDQMKAMIKDLREKNK